LDCDQPGTPARSIAVTVRKGVSALTDEKVIENQNHRGEGGEGERVRERVDGWMDIDSDWKEG
jgi:hypothetical protein